MGVSKFYFFLSLSKDVTSAADSVLTKLSKAKNIELVNADMIGIERLVKKDFQLVEHEMNIDFPKFLEDNNTGISVEEVIDEISSPDVERAFRDAREKFQSGETEKHYQEALEERTDLKDFYETFFDKHRLDALIYPTTPIEAKPTDDCYPSISMDGKRVNTFKTLVQNTSPGSYAGVPSISLPIAKTSRGLPVGMQIEALENHDRLLFEIAKVVVDTVKNDIPISNSEIPSISVTDG